VDVDPDAGTAGSSATFPLLFGELPVRIPPTAGARPAFSLHQKIRDDTARSHPNQVTLAQRKVVLPVAAPALARPDVVLFDIFETVLQLEPLRGRLAEVGRPRHELELFFTRLLCDGMALTLAGEAPPFRDVAAAALCTLSGNTLSEESIKHVLDGEVSAVFDRPTVIAGTLDGVVDGLLALG
jgi:hypothetical protein